MSCQAVQPRDAAGRHCTWRGGSAARPRWLLWTNWTACRDHRVRRTHRAREACEFNVQYRTVLTQTTGVAMQRANIALQVGCAYRPLE